MYSQVQQRDTPFDSAGPVNAPTIVLVHGSVITRKMWIPQLRGLSDSFHIIAPDLPGHGTQATIPFTFSTAMHTLADIIQQEAYGRALVVGLSLGGFVAMELARRSPELVAGLVLSGCSLNFEGLMGSYLKFASWLMWPMHNWKLESFLMCLVHRRQKWQPGISLPYLAIIRAQASSSTVKETRPPAAANRNSFRLRGKDAYKPSWTRVMLAA